MYEALKRLLIFSMALAVPVFAQEFRASISGEVTDPSGAAVAGAKLTITNIERNTTIEESTDGSGRYLVQFLVPGKYTLTVDKAGFKKLVRDGVVLSASDRVALNLKLDLGAIADTVTVTGEVSLLQTESASRSALIENRSIESIPTNGRNLYQLQYTLPGVIKNSRYFGSMELYAFGNINGVTISGGKAGENETLIDGVTGTRADRGVVFAPSLNATQEFTVLANNYDAQYGRVGGGVTSIVIKGGTNALHGQLFNFLKNDKLRANDWIANKDGEARVPFKQNTFGFEVDGPVLIPKIFDGRNKAFWMLSLEGLREHNPGGQSGTLPTSEQLGGDFSKLLNADGDPVTIYDPTTVQLVNGKYVRTPFSNNRIPQNRLNAIATKVASFYPQPTGPGDGPDHQNNYFKVTPSTNSYDSWLGKMDQHFSQKSIVSFKYGQTPWSNFSQLVWGGSNAGEPSGEAPSTRVSRTWGADWTYTLNPTMIFNLRGGLARYEGFSGNVFAKDYDPKQLGFPSSLVSQFLALQFPRFNLGTYLPVGADRVTSYEAHDTWSLTPSVSWMRGAHAIKYGADFRLYNRNQLQPGAASGNYTFNKQWTQADPTRGDNQSGNEFASFLLGIPSSGFVDRNIDPAYRQRYYGLFIQDDFKLRSNLTVNVGLRWDYETPRRERFDRMIRGFAFDQASPIASQVQGLSPKGGLLYAGSSGESRYAFLPKHNQFQPRIGFAWSFRPKWVMRGGYGLSYLGADASGPNTGFSQPTSYIASTDGGINSAANLSDPFPASLYPSGLLKPIGNSLGLSTNLGQGVQAQYLDRALPRSHQYSLGIQREIRGWVIDGSYVGNQTKRIPVTFGGTGLNFLPTSVLESVPVDQRSSYFTTQVTNPMRGLLPNSGLNGATVPRQQLLYAYPQYAGVVITDVPIGSQRYDGLQVKGQRRFSSGFGAQVSYTWSKTIEKVTLLNAQDIDLGNLTNTKLSKRLIDYDIPQKLAVVLNYELPFGKGKRFGSGANRWVNGFIGGWNTNFQTIVQRGFLIDFPNAANLEARSAKFTDDQRDALAKTKGRTQFDVSYDKWFDTSLFPTKAQAPYTLRTYTTRFPDVRTRGLKSTEISLFKNFAIKERLTYQIRADFQNAFNYPVFGQAQSVNVTDSRFGQLRADINNEPRLVVIAMKITF